MNYRIFMIIIIAFEIFFYLLDYFYLSRRKNIFECYRYSSEGVASSIFFSALFFQTKIITAFVILLSYKFLLSFHFFPQINFDRNVFYYILLYLAVDFTFWLTHLLSHKYKWLWYNHFAHHSSARFNYATNWRLGLLEGINFIPAKIFFALIGIPEKDFSYVFLINILHMGWAHTSFPKIKWLEYIFITPSNHRVHHYKGKLGGRNNYGGTFIFWDRLFGTYREEDTSTTPEFGVSGVDGDSIRPIRESLPMLFNLKEKTTVSISKMDLFLAVCNTITSVILLSLNFNFLNLPLIGKSYFAFNIALSWLSAIYFEFQFNLRKNINLTFKLLSIFNLWCLFGLNWFDSWTMPKNPAYLFLGLTFIILIALNVEKWWFKPKNSQL